MIEEHLQADIAERALQGEVGTLVLEVQEMVCLDGLIQAVFHL